MWAADVPSAPAITMAANSGHPRDSQKVVSVAREPCAPGALLPVPAFAMAINSDHSGDSIRQALPAPAFTMAINSDHPGDSIRQALPASAWPTWRSILTQPRALPCGRQTSRLPQRLQWLLIPVLPRDSQKAW